MIKLTIGVDHRDDVKVVLVQDVDGALALEVARDKLVRHVLDRLSRIGQVLAST